MMFQMIVEGHQEITEVSEDNSVEGWFAEIDGKAFSNWLKDALETRNKNKSRSSASRSSSRSSSSRHLSKSNDSRREKALQEKLRVTEYIAET